MVKSFLRVVPYWDQRNISYNLPRSVLSRTNKTDVVFTIQIFCHFCKPLWWARFKTCFPLSFYLHWLSCGPNVLERNYYVPLFFLPFLKLQSFCWSLVRDFLSIPFTISTACFLWCFLAVLFSRHWGIPEGIMDCNLSSRRCNVARLTTLLLWNFDTDFSLGLWGEFC